jgi:hypothetical protein
VSWKNSFDEGKYLYCIVNCGEEKQFGPIGIEDSSVYTVAFNNIAVVVHSCEAEPYSTMVKEKAGEWILAHQCVIDLATEEFGTVIPLTFDTIFRGNNEKLKKWLSKEYNQLETLLKKLDGQAEYGVQIFLEAEFLDKLAGGNDEVRSIEKNLENVSNGVAYLLKKKLEQRKELEKKLIVDRQAKELLSQIKPLVNDAVLGSTNKGVPEKWQDKHMILNAVCLVPKDNIEALGSKLGQLKKEGYAVRFTGPWPPYNFVGQISETRLVRGE